MISLGSAAEYAGAQLIPRQVLFAAVAVLVIAVIWRFISRRYGPYGINRSREELSRLDGLPYRVHPAHSDRGAAADMLARLNRGVLELIRSLRDRPPADPVGRGLRDRLLARYDPDSLVENSPLDPARDTSYSVGKGQVIAVCLRAREAAGGADGDAATAPLHDYDTLFFVVLHELTHVGVDVHDHPPEFWESFRWLIGAAEQRLGWRCPDFAADPRPYCGLVIDYRP